MTALNHACKISKETLLENLGKCMLDYRLAALTKEQGNLVFDYLRSPKEIVFDKESGLLPPKKFFFPQEETLLTYEPNGKIEAVIEAEPLVLFGVRPCDLNGLKLLYEAFAEGHGDPNFLAKWEASIIIGLDCKSSCHEDSFCFKVGAQNAPDGVDILLIEEENEFLLKTGTAKGQAFAEKYLSVEKTQEAPFEAFYEEKKKAFGKCFDKLEKLPEIFSKHMSHEIFEKEAKRCLNCGSCVMVCPTCYCFDVKDQWELNGKKGKRVRSWDGCMLCEFAVVAGGENFREDKKDRLRHRMNRKFNYLMKKHGQSVCVGCGRCVKACLAKISPKTVVEALLEED